MKKVASSDIGSRSGQRWLRMAVVAGCTVLGVLTLGGRSASAADRFNEALKESGEFSCLSQKEAKLLKLVNDYRARYGLKRVPNSRSLNKVARLHAMDLSENDPASGVDSRGIPCNMHSWSGQGFWTPVCYTSDQHYRNLMWKKPEEITNHVYDDVAYENVYWTSADEAFPVRVLESWKKSPEHQALILEKGKWAGSGWNALGVGIYRNLAVIWLGSMVDPLGSMALCQPAGR